MPKHESDNCDEDFELPEISSPYRGWDISVEKHEGRKFLVICIHYNSEDYEDDRLEIDSDEIGSEDVETYVNSEIDHAIERQQDADDYNEHYGSYMGLDDDYFES